jgi:uncharacterized protein YuzE
MSAQTHGISFEISISGRNDGTLEALYVQIIPELSVSRTEEIRRDVLLADYAEDGRLVGVEVLAPVRIADIEKLVKDKSFQKAFREFLNRSAPKELVTA